MVTLDAYAPGAIDRTPDLAKSTRTTYKGAVRSAGREHFGAGVPVDRLTADAVERYYSTIGHLAAKTRQTRIVALGVVARRAVRDGLLAPEHHPAHWGITVRGDQPTPRRLLTDAELDRLAAAMLSHLWAAVIIGNPPCSAQRPGFGGVEVSRHLFCTRGSDKDVLKRLIGKASPCPGGHWVPCRGNAAVS